MVEGLSEDEFIDWVNHPTTRKIQELLEIQAEQERIDLTYAIAGTSKEHLMYKVGVLDGMEATIKFKELFNYGHNNKKEDEDET